jgi:hypothetical protein
MWKVLKLSMKWSVWLFAYLGGLKIFPCCDDTAWPKHIKQIKLMLVPHIILLLVCILGLIESASGIMYSYNIFIFRFKLGW